MYWCVIVLIWRMVEMIYIWEAEYSMQYHDRCRGLMCLYHVRPSCCCLCFCCWRGPLARLWEYCCWSGEMTYIGRPRRALPPGKHGAYNTEKCAHTHIHTYTTLNALDFIWGLSASHAIPSGEKWSQSESRWEVRPGVQALHLSSVIKTGTLGPSHPIEEKMERERERGSADPGLLLLSLEICEAWLTPSPCPIYTYLWNA